MLAWDLLLIVFVRSIDSTRLESYARGEAL